MSAGRLVTLYGRPGCHLCEQARGVLERVRTEIPFELAERDITEDDDLHRTYFERIPVVLLDGRELCELFVDEHLLRRSLGAPPSSPELEQESIE